MEAIKSTIWLNGEPSGSDKVIVHTMAYNAIEECDGQSFTWPESALKLVCKDTANRIIYIILSTCSPV